MGSLFETIGSGDKTSLHLRAIEFLESSFVRALELPIFLQHMLKPRKHLELIGPCREPQGRKVRTPAVYSLSA
jgi:hypothetical protein